MKRLIIGITAALDKLAVYVTALDTDARLKVFDDHFGAINDVSRNCNGRSRR